MLNNAICVEVCVVMGNINLLSCIWWFLIFQTRGREGLNAGLLEYHGSTKISFYRTEVLLDFGAYITKTFHSMHSSGVA